MSRTYGGGIFTCKHCGNKHLIPYHCIPTDKRKTIEVPCLSVPDTY